MLRDRTHACLMHSSRNVQVGAKIYVIEKGGKYVIFGHNFQIPLILAENFGSF